MFHNLLKGLFYQYIISLPHPQGRAEAFLHSVPNSLKNAGSGSDLPIRRNDVQEKSYSAAMAALISASQDRMAWIVRSSRVSSSQPRFSAP